MNKILFIPLIAFLAVFMIQSCDSQKTVLKDVPEDKLDGSYTVSMNDTLTLKLASNPSTGFKWNMASKLKPAIIKELNVEFVKEEKAMDMVGAGGYELWTFLPKKEGILFLHFKYEREDGKTKKEKYIQVVVKE